MDKRFKTDGSISEILAFNPETKVKRPLIFCPIPAGFPSPATDYLEGSLDLNEYLIQSKSSTFFVRVAGFSMINAGIHPDDILIVDRSLEAAHKKIVVAVLDGEFTVKRLHIQDDAYYLLPENDQFEAIKVDKYCDFYVWGVVTYVIHKL